MEMSQNKVDMSKHERIQKFGRFLSGMVMPNIGAFIAWGFITALFIPTGWIPNESLSSLVGPMILYLLPILIGYTGGKLVGGVRGGVVGAVATMGVVVGVSIPMFIGAMIMGPIGGLAIKKFDAAVEGKTKAGFEMLVNNFSAGIIGMILALIAYVGIGPLVEAFSTALGSGVEAIVNAGLLPISSVFIEPAKILFLNNAINHGVLSPLGVADAAEVGKSIFFLLETNPGPGLGILLAYYFFGKGTVKNSTPGAIVIHFLGGIHEIYFPYVLMKPILVLAVIAGGASGVLIFSLFGAGLVATPSPGSIFALIAMTPKGGLFPVLAGVVVAAVVSFLVAGIFIKSSKNQEEDLEDAKEQMIQLKGKESKVVKTRNNVKKIVVACDAGMGSSAMGATSLRNKIKEAGLDIEVINTAIESIPKDADIVITQENLTKRAMSVAKDAEHISIDKYVDNEIYDSIINSFYKNNKSKKVRNPVIYESEQTILRKDNIRLQLPSESKIEAIERAGLMLVNSGYVEESYIDSMKKREELTTTYIGNNLAIPHGIGEGKESIKKSGIVVLQYPNGIKFDDDKIAYLVIGIAGKGNEHIAILSNIAKVFEREETVLNIARTTDVNEIYDLFTKMNEVKK